MTRGIRKLLFWAHLAAGVSAGLVILIMCVTGALLVLEEPITTRADGHRSTTNSESGSRVSLDKVFANASRENPGAPPASVIIRSDLSLPIVLSFGREKALLFDPVSGEFLGEGSRFVRSAFRFITDWHRWLGRPESSRATGKSITGASNLAFVFLVLSGIFLWFPRKWSKGAFRAGAVLSLTARGRARDWNWHNVLGIWCAIPLLVVAGTATVISYPWASNLVYRLAGSEPPARTQRPEAKAGSKQNLEGWKVEGFDRALLLAEQEVPGAKTVRARFAANSGPVTFSFDPPDGLPQKRSQITVDLENGKIVRRDLAGDHDRGRRWRLLARFLHTGEAAGVLGRVVAAGASLGGAILVWTGLSLAIRRFFGRKQAEPASTVPVHEEVV